ncbi:hypothetical protein K8S19_06205 [bacterium]|nr:hypothetical protein [bacterium]
MNHDPSPVAFGLVVMGALFSLGREMIAKGYIRMYRWIKKKETDNRLQKGVEIYLMMTGMIFTIVGLLGMFNVIRF